MGMASSSRQPNGPASSASANGAAKGADFEDDMPDEWPSGPVARVNSVAASSPADKAVSLASSPLWPLARKAD